MSALSTTPEYKREYMNAYNKSRKGDEYYTLMKRLNNKLSYHRKHHGLTDDDAEYQTWRLLYPELINLKETLDNINLIMSNNSAYDHVKDKLHDLIDEIVK